MSKSLLAVRIPETMHTYIKVQAAQKGMYKQDLVAEIISAYQQSDENYINSLSQPKQNKSDEVEHGI